MDVEDRTKNPRVGIVTNRSILPLATNDFFYVKPEKIAVLAASMSPILNIIRLEEFLKVVSKIHPVVSLTLFPP